GRRVGRPPMARWRWGALAAAALVGLASVTPAAADAAVVAPAAARAAVPGPVAEPGPPAPPRVSVTPPRGLPPGPAPGIRAAARRAPPRADAAGVPSGRGRVARR